MKKILWFFGIVFLFSCSEREMVNKDLIGTWKLVDIQCEQLDSIQGLTELQFYEDEFNNNFKLVINDDSKYIILMELESYVTDEVSGNLRPEAVLFEECGVIKNESIDVIQWKSLFIRENNEKRTSFISGNKMVNQYKLIYWFGPMPNKKTIQSQYKLEGTSLVLINDNRLSYYEGSSPIINFKNKIKTKLIFEKE